MSILTLPKPSFYDADKVVDHERWINYADLLATAADWRKEHNIPLSVKDRKKVGLLVIDAQNTFCHPDGELYVGGRSGTGAIDDSRRLVEFIYANLAQLSVIHCTLDTHRGYAVFHPTFLVDQQGNHPAPYTLVTYDDVKNGVWTVSSLAASALGNPLPALNQHLRHYTEALAERGRYALMVWPFHGMLGGKGHCLVSGLEEAVNFHGFVRGSQPGFEVKGTHPLVENYSVLGPEVTTLLGGVSIPRNTSFIEKLMGLDLLIIAGQAKSHCVAWTIDDLLSEIKQQDERLARKVVLLEDCTSSVVDLAHGIDFTDDADAAFDRFKAEGMQVGQTTGSIQAWLDKAA